MPVPSADPGPFINTLQWLGDWSQVPLNALRGRPGTAAKWLGQQATDVVDAVLPGDWIPELVGQEDRARPSEMLGVDRRTDPGWATAADILGETAANPLSWLTGGLGARGGATLKVLGGAELPGLETASLKAAEGVRKGWDMLPDPVTDWAGNVAKSGRRTFNWLDLEPGQQDLFAKAKGSGDVASRAGIAEVERLYGGLTAPEREAMGEMLWGIRRKGDNRADWSVLPEAERDAYLQSLPDVRPDVIRKALAERRPFVETQAKEAIARGVMDPATPIDNEYLHRQFLGDQFDKAAFIGQKKLTTPESVLDYMRANPDVDLDFDALKADIARAQGQGRAFERQALGQSQKGDDFKLHNADQRREVEAAIDQMPDTDFRYKLKNAFNGTPPRSDNWFTQGLATANKVFKGAATYGVILPRVSFNVRNRIGGLWQTLSTEGARGTIGDSSKRALTDLLGAFDDGLMKLTGSRRTGSDLTKDLDLVESAFAGSGGSAQKAMEVLKDRPDLQAALNLGVMDNFVSSEELLRRMASDSRWAKAVDMSMWPSAIGQGLEQRMRLGTFKDLLASDKSPEEAARIIKDTFLDYSIPGVANRTFRDVIPFGAFMSQTIPQQAKFIAKYPVVGVAASQLYGDDEGLPKYPWLEQQMSYPFGLDEKGNPQYLTGLGLPLEALEGIPGLSGSDIYSDVVGSMQPFLKTGIAYATGIDPFTGGDWGEYSKVFGQDLGAAGRAINIAKGTGLTQPITGALDQFAPLFDERTNAAEKAARMLTGVRTASVDPDLAERRKLEAYLETRPDIQTAPAYYQTGEDGDLSAVLKELREVKERLAEKRKAAAAL